MDQERFKRMKKQMKTHEVCPNCKKHTEKSCQYGSSCLIQHCACGMTNG